MSPPETVIAPAPFERLVSPSGVPVACQLTRKYKSVLVLWVLEAPLDDGRAARALLPDLLTRATARHPDLASLSARCEELFNTELVASVTAHGSRQILRLGFETVADRFTGGLPLFEQAGELLGDVLRAPPLVDGRLRDDHLATERANLVRAIEGLADDKGLYAWRRLVETMHAGTAFAHHSWGTVAQAEALDEPGVHAAWDALRDELPARLFVVGDVAREQVLALADALGGGGSRQAAVVSAPPADPRRDVREVVEEQAINQTRLGMGFRLPAERLAGPGPGLFATVFGGGSHSRLFKRVREAESLAYGCSASAVTDAGTLVVQAGVEPGDAERARDAVLDELARLARDGLSAEEFELSRRAQLRRLRNLRDSPRDLAGFRLFGLVTGRTFDLDEALGAVQAATPDDVVALAAETRLDTVYRLEGARP